MFEIGEWEENTEREKNLISDLFGSQSLVADKAIESTRKKKRKRKAKEDNESLPKQQKISKEVSSLESELNQNGRIKVKGKKSKISCSKGESTETLASNEAVEMTSSKKRRAKTKRQKQGSEDSKTKDKNGNKKRDESKKNTKQNLIDLEATGMSNKSDEEHQNFTGSNHEKLKANPNKKTDLQEKLKRKLESSRFRWINEQLYTITGDEALELFKRDESMFDVYHQGFRRQVEHWPVNPVDVIIEWIKQRPKSLVLADFGCGEAAIAQSVPNKVYSFDLVAKNDWVTPCNMAKVPLSSNSVDIAIFCLSLMGTDLESFISEAYRVLKPGGVLKIAEVVSRIDVSTFLPSLSQFGFKVDSLDDSNKMFILIDLTKDHLIKKSTTKSDLSGLSLKPCIYKRR